MAFNQYSPWYRRIDNVIKVRGIDMANSYPMGANDSAVFLDEDEDWMYYRETDSNGVGEAEWFDFFKHAETGDPIDVEPEQDYVTRDDFDALVAMVEDMEKALERAKARTTRKAVSNG